MNEKKFNLVSIDAGASKKINKLAEHLYNQGFTGVNIIQCNKKRNVTNGKIESFEVFADDLQGLPTVIVDDIADGGMSFIFAADKLKEKNAGDLYLAISHGIFSKGFKELNKRFKKIFTTDSFPNIEDEDFLFKNNNNYHKVVQIKLWKCHTKK